MKTLVLVEHEGGAIKDATLATVTAASQLGDVDLLVAGSGVGSVADAAVKIAGAGTVHVADAAHLEHQLAEDVAPIAVALMADRDAFLASATTTGKNVAPRVAALLDVEVDQRVAALLAHHERVGVEAGARCIHHQDARRHEHAEADHRQRGEDDDDDQRRVPTAGARRSGGGEPRWWRWPTTRPRWAGRTSRRRWTRPGRRRRDAARRRRRRRGRWRDASRRRRRGRRDVTR